MFHSHSAGPPTQSSSSSSSSPLSSYRHHHHHHHHHHLSNGGGAGLAVGAGGSSSSCSSLSLGHNLNAPSSVSPTGTEGGSSLGHQLHHHISNCINPLADGLSHDFVYLPSERPKPSLLLAGTSSLWQFAPSPRHLR
ncbi:uncharacterized protein LOC134209763 [Armigeres subalbatus]|uniref:uncharacterized protein LOC134209763 n=1 Tax=Armigeres subalbatus TaxID=124917 RepID=UPI002ED3132B